MGCLLGCFEKTVENEPKLLDKHYKILYQDFYIDYYLATRFDLWD
jgi:hypothetical protein